MEEGRGGGGGEEEVRGGKEDLEEDEEQETGMKLDINMNCYIIIGITRC